MKPIYFLVTLLTLATAYACKTHKQGNSEQEEKTAKELYTCPMPEDSVFSDTPSDCPKCGMKLVKVETPQAKTIYTCPMPEDSVFSDTPGDCPKCGMNLVKVEQDPAQHQQMEYTCAMHPEISRDQPGTCPICGMNLVKKEIGKQVAGDLTLESLLKPTNEFVVSSIPVTTIERRSEPIQVEAFGNIAYDTRQIGTISARVTGRIEKLYVRYRYQKISKGQKIMDIYSPELLTAQQNLLFLLKNDADNTPFINAAKEKLLLLGMSTDQLNQVIQHNKSLMTISVYSNYSGHIHEATRESKMNPEPGIMKDIALLTEELPLKEGMYIQKGQTVFSVYNPDRAWVLLNIFGEHQLLVKKGDIVRVTPETAPSKDFRASISFIEPFYRKESKTLTARVYFDNSQLKIPIGSQVRATIFGNSKDANWLPKEAVLSLGMDWVVFQKTAGGFKARKVGTGITHGSHIQVINGLSITDSVAANAQFLMDSESFIKVNSEW